MTRLAVPALLLALTGCAGDGRAADDATDGAEVDASTTPDTAEADTVTALTEPPENAQEPCEAAGWTWFTDSYGVYCGGEPDCELTTYAMCVMPCESDADCASLTRQRCEYIWVGEGGDVLHCSPYRMCVAHPGPEYPSSPTQGQAGCARGPE